ncbi:MAG: histidine phosphotransferase family protein [Alphaproteobacteria bacterium]|nr:histidine phosphotransferase family protein [Alphaproteobacteria bacterium]
MRYNETPLMTAKICHDLATPLSAMSLLMDLAFDKCVDPHIEATFRESLEKATLKLQFFRLLLTINQEHPVYSDVHSMLTKAAHALKIRLILPSECPDGPGSRLLLGLTNILMEGLIRGGAITVVVEADVLRLTAEGEPLQLRPGYLEALTNVENIEVHARNILPHYLANLAASMRLGIKVSILNKERIVIETVVKR